MFCLLTISHNCITIILARKVGDMMYQLKDTSKISIINQSRLARKIGVNQATLNRIFNQKQNCSKIMAYVICKAINENAEIDDYFIKKGE